MTATTEPGELGAVTRYARTDHGENTTLRVHGAVDLAQRVPFAAAVGAALSQPRTVVEIDLAAVDFMDSSGIHVLLEARRSVRAVNARLVLVNPSRPLLRVLETCRLTVLFEIDGRGNDDDTGTADGGADTYGNLVRP